MLILLGENQSVKTTKGILLGGENESHRSMGCIILTSLSIGHKGGDDLQMFVIIGTVGKLAELGLISFFLTPLKISATRVLFILARFALASAIACSRSATLALYSSGVYDSLTYF